MLVTSLAAAFLMAEAGLWALDAARGMTLSAHNWAYWLYVPDDASGWALRPGVHIRGAWEARVNTHGFRGPPVPVDRPAGVRRVLCLGGSSVFGFGSPEDEDTWPEALQRSLRASLKDPRVQVLNGGVVGYASLECASAYRSRWRAWKPDVVVVSVVWNDLKTFRSCRTLAERESIRHRLPPPSAWAALWNRSRLCMLVHNRLPGGAGEPGPAAPLPGRGFPGAEVYEGILRSLAGEVLSDGAGLVLANEATAIRASPAHPALEGRLGLDYVGMDKEACLAAFDEADAALRRAAQGGRVAFADLRELLPAEPSFFLDHIHLTADGNREVAEAIAPAVAALLPPAAAR